MSIKPQLVQDLCPSYVLVWKSKQQSLIIPNCLYFQAQKNEAWTITEEASQQPKGHIAWLKIPPGFHWVEASNVPFPMPRLWRYRCKNAPKPAEYFRKNHLQAQLNSNLPPIKKIM